MSLINAVTSSNPQIFKEFLANGLSSQYFLFLRNRLISFQFHLIASWKRIKLVTLINIFSKLESTGIIWYTRHFIQNIDSVLTSRINFGKYETFVLVFNAQ